MSEPKIAVFDVDGTLLHGDSLLPFLRAAVGRRRLSTAVVGATAAYLRHKSDRRGCFKSALLQRTLAGRALDSFEPACRRLYRRMRRRKKIVQLLHKHYDDGYTIVIASGALDLYLPALLQGLPYQALLCTQTEVEHNMLTGRIVENCVREVKARRFAEYLQDYEAEHGPCEEVIGYGNAPHDLPMLQLCRRRVII